MTIASTFWGLTANGWTAVATVALALFTFLLTVATAAIAWVAYTQLESLREEAKRSRTLTVCERYDTDPVIDQALRNLAGGWRSRDIHYNPKRYGFDLATVINFLESIVSGVERDIYDEEIVKSYFHDTFRIHIEDYVTSKIVNRMDIGEPSYIKMVRFSEKWDNEAALRDG